jgi:hypothetical protein
LDHSDLESDPWQSPDTSGYRPTRSRSPTARRPDFPPARDDREGLAARIHYARTGESVRNKVYLPQEAATSRAAPMPTCTGRRLALERLAAHRQDGRRTTPKFLRAVLASASRQRAAD